MGYHPGDWQSGLPVAEKNLSLRLAVLAAFLWTVVLGISLAWNFTNIEQQGMAMAYAEALNGEIADLFAAGADVVQIDEPWMQARPEAARDYGLKALNVALDGHTGTTAATVPGRFEGMFQVGPPPAESPVR